MSRDRGVARTGVCFALEVLLDAIARALDMDPIALRLKNLVGPERMPFDNVTGKHFDSGDYPECLRRAAAAIDLPAVRERQRRNEPDGRRIGVGFAIFCEQAAHGTSVYAAWGVPMIPGHEQAGARMTPSGGLELRVGVHSHGQGLETTIPARSPMPPTPAWWRSTSRPVRRSCSTTSWWKTAGCSSTR